MEIENVTPLENKVAAAVGDLCAERDLLRAALEEIAGLARDERYLAQQIARDALDDV